MANRGEIARRVFRTVRQMGLGTVAVFSDADRDASFVAEADEAVRLGPAPSAESYLNQEAVLAAAAATGADAVHPGYGFLSENADFADRCRDAGLVFIGPSPEAIRSMGDKAAAKALAAEAGVPVLRGFDLAGLSESEIQAKAEETGYPLLVKAVAGGGGKGMRRVDQAKDLANALAAAAREAESAFGNGTLLIERFVESPRHVEIQVLGDQHGHVIHCFERDCSVQRRHQKVFEEAPSPAVDEALRNRMGEATVALARAVEYEGAGTVEFLLDANGDFFFLEMNTRLQVEHPVTEAVTGLDLVRLQVEIAQGLKLNLAQDDLKLNGHAIEARLYAEDPANDFLPATGQLSLWSPPKQQLRSGTLRIDSGVEQGQEIGIHYDPMLAKVIAHGAHRDEAVQRLHQGLNALAVGGVTTNRDFLIAVLENEAFRQGKATTHFIEENFSSTQRTFALSPEVLNQHLVAATLHLFKERRQTPGPTPPGVPPGWRNNRWRPQEQVFEHDGEQHDGKRHGVRYSVTSQNAMTVRIGDENARDVRLVSQDENVLVVEIDGLRRTFHIGGIQQGSQQRLSVHGLGAITELNVVPRFPERESAAVAGGCAAPMTGKIVQVLVEKGAEVEEGATLVVLEAMKMEHQLKAQTAGIVEDVRVEEGQMVDPDDVLVIVTPATPMTPAEEEEEAGV